MLINLSNHPSTSWSFQQLEAAQTYDEIVDLPFPIVDPEADETDIATLSEEYFLKIKQVSSGKKVVVHLMGEMTLSFNLIQRLKDADITCIASTSERIIKEIDSGKKEVTFQFKRFRKYV